MTKHTVASVVALVGIVFSMFTGCSESSEPVPLIARVGEITLSKAKLNDRMPAMGDAETRARRQ